MGKNQAYKAMQRAKMASQNGSGGTEDVEDGMMDGSFHSPEWHAARLANLQTSHTITWEEYKRRQKDEAKKKEEQEDGELQRMKEYRAQLDAERASKLARGINHIDKKAWCKGKKEKDKEKRKKESRRKRKHSSESDSELENDVRHKSRRKGREKTRHERKSRDRKSRKRSSTSSSSTDSSNDEAHGPVPLSSFFDSCEG
ncbi:hypothetical protein KP509_28G059700 [Ceratopteris richardii]|uniref:Uncharacterized protein n=1 Tax=Ceratopteris richardii TaxID=49495 RepID=A0A8T2REF2_CERRI|nr:hypothetical protein KP509_28G059700 [Ceratopteris richardii]